MSERTSYAPGTPCWVELGTPDIEAPAASTASCSAGRSRSCRELEPNWAATAGRKRTARTSPGDAADAGGPAAGLEHLRLGRGRRRDRGGGRGGRRQRHRRADGRDRTSAGWRSSPTRPAPSSASGSRARSPAPSCVNEPGAFALERARHPRPRGRQGVLRRRLRLGLRRARDGRDGHLHDAGRSARRLGRRHDGHHAAACPTRCPPTGSSTSRSRTPTRRWRRSRRRAASVVLRPDRHPGRPLRRRHRPVRRRLRRDRSPARRRGDAVAPATRRSSRGRRPLRPGSPASPSSSHSAGWPRLALLTIFRPSIAHFIRVAEISIPSSSSTYSFGSRSSSSRDLPTSSSVSSEVAAVEIAQPLPSKAISATRSSLVEPDRHVLLVAAERVGVLELEVGLVDVAEVVRPLVVLEDLVAVELVHAIEASEAAALRRGRAARAGHCESLRRSRVARQTSTGRSYVCSSPCPARRARRRARRRAAARVRPRPPARTRRRSSSASNSPPSTAS